MSPVARAPWPVLLAFALNMVCNCEKECLSHGTIGSVNLAQYKAVGGLLWLTTQPLAVSSLLSTELQVIVFKLPVTL